MPPPEVARQALVVLAHPEPSSFNAALARAAVSTLAARGWRVETTDLYAARFDPISDRRNFATTPVDRVVLRLQREEAHAAQTGGFRADIAREQQKLLGSDLIIWQFPLWWGGMPAILKGWVDRVFAAGVAYGGGRSFATGALRGRAGLLSVTTGGGAPRFSASGFGTVADVLHPITRCVLEFVGLTPLAPQVLHQPDRQSPAARAAALAAWQERLASIETEIRAARLFPAPGGDLA